MIIAHRAGKEGCTKGETRLSRIGDEADLAGAVWIDLINPTPEEDAQVEKHLDIAIPTREEMRDLEPSELIYTEGNGRYMTARVICHSETDVPRLADVTFILTEKALVTVRYAEPGAFSIFTNRATKPGGCGSAPEGILDGLIDAIVDRAAEVLRGVGDKIDHASRKVFDGRSREVEQGGAYQRIIRSIGQYEHIISNVRESMVSIERVLLFLSAGIRTVRRNRARPSPPSGAPRCAMCRQSRNTRHSSAPSSSSIWMQRSGLSAWSRIRSSSYSLWCQLR
jgi:Mg2+ and Co2+ transporter CorA